MKRDNLRHLLLNMIQIARNIFPNSKLFIFLFLLLKFTGVIIISNALEHHIEKNINTYYLFQQITFYVSLTRKKINLLPYPIECIIIYFLLCLPVITFFFIIINHTKLFNKKQHIKRFPLSYIRRLNGIVFILSSLQALEPYIMI